MLTNKIENVKIGERNKAYRIIRRTRASNNRYVFSKVNNSFITFERKIKEHVIDC